MGGDVTVSDTETIFTPLKNHPTLSPLNADQNVLVHSIDARQSETTHGGKSFLEGTSIQLARSGPLLCWHFNTSERCRPCEICSSRKLRDGPNLSSTRYVLIASVTLISFIPGHRDPKASGFACRCARVTDVGAAAHTELEALLLRHPGVANGAAAGVVSEEEATELPGCVQALRRRCENG